jgi:hypothetical protein
MEVTNSLTTTTATISDDCQISRYSADHTTERSITNPTPDDELPVAITKDTTEPVYRSGTRILTHTYVLFKKRKKLATAVARRITLTIVAEPEFVLGESNRLASATTATTRNGMAITLRPY